MILHSYCVPYPGMRTPEVLTSSASYPEGQKSPPGTAREKKAQREGTARS